jgi:solute carrier family 45 protein 1/2/4
MSGFGNILGYLSGYVNLPKYLGFFGNTQFKVLCIIAVIALTSTVGISCLSIQERDPRLEGNPPPQKGGVLSFFADLFRSIKRLPPQVRKVCAVQFFAWIGWFPFLFYITTYIGEIYVEPYFIENPHMSPKEIDATWERATRIGTFALLIFAFVNLGAAVVLPMLIAPGFEAPPPLAHTPLTPRAFTPTTPRSMTGSDYFAYTPQHSSSKLDLSEQNRWQRIKSSVPSVQMKAFTLRRAWILSHLLFAGATFLTFFVRDTTTATVLVAFIGIPWALSNWAPFALIAAEISKRETARRNQMPVPANAQRVDGDDEEGEDQAGVILGIHNVAIAAPQVIATLVSSAIFKLLQKPRGMPGDNSVAWVLRFGGLAALVAAYLTTRIAEEGEEEES